MPETITVLMPNAEAEAPTSRRRPRLKTLEGKTIAFVDNVSWTSCKITFQEFERTMREEYGIKGSVYFQSHGQGRDQAHLKKLAEEVDAAVTGLAN